MTDKPRPAWELEEEAWPFNAELWEPLGMVKRQCSWCRYWFAAPADSPEPRCPLAGRPPQVRNKQLHRRLPQCSESGPAVKLATEARASETQPCR